MGSDDIANTLRDDPGALYDSSPRVRLDTVTLDDAGHAARYRIGEALGEGGMGEVRRCRDRRGEAGIGKSRLSGALKDWIDGQTRPPEWDEPPQIDRHVRTVRMDLGGFAAADLEHLMLRIRAEISTTGVPLYAFDLGLKTYWSLAHPESPFPGIRARDPVPLHLQLTGAHHHRPPRGVGRRRGRPAPPAPSRCAPPAGTSVP